MHSELSSSAVAPDAAERERLRRLVDFLYEAGMLRHTPRSGYAFLGSGRESVAEHCHRTAVIGYVLARLSGADPARTVLLCLFHDLAETRTGDLNYVQQLYCTADERSALADATAGTGLTDDILDFHAEFEARETPEALLAKDADQLDLILNLKRESDLGNPYAAKWLDNAEQRLRTPPARDLAAAVRSTDHTDWWFLGQNAEWWAHRKR